MYKELKNYFFNEIRSDTLLKLPEDFYEKVREYIKKLEDEKEKERAKYYYRELRKLRIYKAMYFDRENLLKEEEEILNKIEFIEEEPKGIYTIKDIEVVKVNKQFPQFTDGNFIYNLNKEEVITLDKKIATILEKHGIISKLRVRM
ncbi:hypothetical protein J422_00806 [Methanocaldococcus villosus KIN24-T80]|uniref:DNA replication complex GINS family protein n=1 Tax=Methanocaldococcus villosus KIN24-T80 TaxID=1069083 RepID=N6VU58_9EURY|nr:hypothetical protein [Methanocaldococcus villosus]ENN96731.1 hypothetical protein J422_00806 [Methanocaldococcus villosus KIN24-T80]